MPRQDLVQQLIDHLRASSGGPAGGFAAGRPLHVCSAPGRLDVLGGLGADAGGTLAQLPLRRRAAVAVQRREGAESLFVSDQVRPPVGEAEIVAGPEMPTMDAGWAAGLLAAWRALCPPTDGHHVPGVSATVRSDIPINAGQASSTALLAAFVAAAADMLQRPLEPAAMANIVQASELAAARCPPSTVRAGWTIDALTCLLAERAAPSLLRYNAQPHGLVGAVPLPPEVQILALNTGVRNAAAAPTLEELRVAGAMGQRLIETIYRDLGQPHTPLHGYLANTSPLLYRQYFRALLPKRMRASDFVRTFGALPDAVGPGDPAAFYRVRTVVDHLIAEHEHAEQFLQAMEELAAGESDPGERRRTLGRAGRLLLASHHSYRLRLDLSCREADWLVDKLMQAGPEKGIFGARITACGGGGTVLALLDRTAEAADVILETLRGYNAVTGLTLGITEGGGDAAAGALRTPPRVFTPGEAAGPAAEFSP